MATAASAVPGGSVDLALEGCTVIVTGAGSGIGAATARLLGAAGASVVLVGRREDPLRQSADAIEQAGGRAVPVPADLADRDQPGPHHRRRRWPRSAGSTAWSTTRPCASTGRWPSGRPTDSTSSVATNIRAPYFLIQAALPALRESADQVGGQHQLVLGHAAAVRASPCTA